MSENNRKEYNVELLTAVRDSVYFDFFDFMDEDGVNYVDDCYEEWDKLTNEVAGLVNDYHDHITKMCAEGKAAPPNKTNEGWLCSAWAFGIYAPERYPYHVTNCLFAYSELYIIKKGVRSIAPTQRSIDGK